MLKGFMKNVLKGIIALLALTCVVSAFAAGNAFSAIGQPGVAGADESGAPQFASPLPSPAPAVPTLKERGTIDKIVAVVNDDVITESELDAQIALAKRDLEHATMSMPSASALRTQVLNHLVDVKLQLQLAGRAHISVTDNEVDKAIATIAARNNASLSELRDQLAEQGIDYGEFRKQIHEQMIISRVEQAAFGHEITVSAAEVDAAIKAQQGGEALTKEEAQNLVYQKKFVQRLQSWLKELRASAYIKIN